MNELYFWTGEREGFLWKPQIHLAKNRRELTHDMARSNHVSSRFFKRVPQKTVTGFLRRLAVGPYHTFGKYTFYALLCFGLAGVLIDLDHLIIREMQMVRPFHLPYWTLVGVVCLGYHTYLRRRVHHRDVTNH